MSRPALTYLPSRTGWAPSICHWLTLQQSSSLSANLRERDFAHIYAATDAASKHTADVIHEISVRGRALQTHAAPLLNAATGGASDGADGGDNWLGDAESGADETEPPELLTDVRARVAMGVRRYILPHLVSEDARVDICLVAGATVCNELLQQLIQLNDMRLAALQLTVQRPMMFDTSPLESASYHQVDVRLAQPASTLSVKVVSLCERAHLHEWPTVRHSEPMSPPLSAQSAAHSPTFPAKLRVSDPAATPLSAFALAQADTERASLRSPSQRTEGSSPGRLRPVDASPNRTRLMEPASIPGVSNRSSSALALTHPRYGGDAHGQAPAPALAPAPKSLQSYDMSMMVQSIDKWDPVRTLVDADAAEMPESPTTPFGFGTHVRENTLASSAIPRLPTPASVQSSMTIPQAVSPPFLPARIPTLSPSSSSQYIPSVGSQGSATAVSHLQTPFNNMSAFAQNLFTSSGGDSAATAGDPASQGGFLWHNICVRLFPLFNDEPLGVPVEELHEAVQ